MIIIALAGRAQHGKSSLAKVLVEYLVARKIQVHKMAFADPMKGMLRELGIPHDSVYGTGAQKEATIPAFGGVSGRHLMQTLGTGWGRKLIGDDFWCIVLERRLRHAQGVIVIDDVRHVPEIEMLRRHGAYIFEIYRPGVVPKTLWGKFKAMFAHSSERLNFQKHGLDRIVVEEGGTALNKLLAKIPELQ